MGIYWNPAQAPFSSRYNPVFFNTPYFTRHTTGHKRGMTDARRPNETAGAQRGDDPQPAETRATLTAQLQFALGRAARSQDRLHHANHARASPKEIKLSKTQPRRRMLLSSLSINAPHQDA